MVLVSTVRQVFLQPDLTVAAGLNFRAAQVQQLYRSDDARPFVDAKRNPSACCKIIILSTLSTELF